MVNEFIQERKKLVIFTVIILFLLLGLLYFRMIYPLKDETQMAKTNVTQLETEIAALQNQLDVAEQEQYTEVGNEFELAKKMPLAREIDALILSFEEIALISNSRIENISFNEYDGNLSADDLINDTEAEEEEEMTESEQDLTEESESEADFERSTEEVLPENIKQLTISLSVTSPDFEHFELFLKELEKLERLIRVNTLQFSQPTEQELMFPEQDEPVHEVSTEMELTTFYYVEME